MPLVNVLKLSDEDAAWLYPDLDPVQAVHEIQRSGPQFVALTRGDLGALLVVGQMHVHLECACVSRLLPGARAQS